MIFYSLFLIDLDIFILFIVIFYRDTVLLGLNRHFSVSVVVSTVEKIWRADVFDGLWFVYGLEYHVFVYLIHDILYLKMILLG